MWRIRAVFCFFSAFFVVIIFRLFYWQIIIGEKLKLQAVAQHYQEFSLPAARGTVLASDGSPLVMNQAAFLVYAQPKKIQSLDHFVQLVSPILSLDKQKLSFLLGDKSWIPLDHKVDTHVVEQLKTLKLEGIGFEKEPKRYYPEASLAAHLLGFVGSDENGKDKGYFGIEGYYDRELRGRDGLIELEKDVRGSPILVGDAKRVEAEDGRSLILWIDRTIQHIVEQRLEEGIKKYGAKEGSVVVMDPVTGGILAAASYPSYTPSSFGSFDVVLYKNPIVASSYEPGSTFKALVMSAALEEKEITPSATMEETGPIKVGEYTIRTWNNEYHGAVTMSQVLEHSSNVGMVFVAKKLGKERMIRYIRNFGFGEPTNVDLEEESSPELRADADWKEIDLVTASFGQGIAVTPLQMVRAIGALANGGKLMEPHVVKEIRDSAGRVIHVKPKVVRSVLSPSTTKLIAEMMVSAVDNGEARWAKPRGYRIAGKTGTAQIPVAGHYDDKKTIASFVGFAPADRPRIVMLVTLREPTSSPWGSETAAPLFFAIARDLFIYLGIPPSQ